MGNWSYLGEEPCLYNHPCQGWGPACTMSPLPQARGSPSHRHRLEQAQAGAAPGEANICFLSVNPQTEECRVTTCVAPWGGSCVWRDAGMSLFGCAVYFLNICGRKQEPGGGMWGQG